jgi:hypothetical protein
MNQTHVSDSHSATPIHEEGDINIVALWLRFDLPRLMAGAMAGAFAGVIMAIAAGVFARLGGHEFLYPVKVAALPILGNGATNYGMHIPAITLGFVVHEAICVVLGMVYAHFTQTNKLLPLIGAGFMWGTFSWVFIQNLFVRSFLEVRTEELPSGVAFFVLLIFGFSLVSVRIFDRMICGRER